MEMKGYITYTKKNVQIDKKNINDPRDIMANTYF